MLYSQFGLTLFLCLTDDYFFTLEVLFIFPSLVEESVVLNFLTSPITCMWEKRS